MKGGTLLVENEMLKAIYEDIQEVKSQVKDMQEDMHGMKSQMKDVQLTLENEVRRLKKKVEEIV